MKKIADTSSMDTMDTKINTLIQIASRRRWVVVVSCAVATLLAGIRLDGSLALRRYQQVTRVLFPGMPIDEFERLAGNPMEKDKFTRYPSKSAEKGNEPTSGYVYIYVYRTYCVHYLNLPFTWRPTLYVKLKDNAVVSWELCEDRPIPFSLSDWKRSGFLRRNDMVESMMRYAATHFLTIDDVVDGLGQPSVVDDEDTTRYTVADLHSFDPRAVYFRFDKSTRKVTEISLR